MSRYDDILARLRGVSGPSLDLDNIISSQFDVSVKLGGMRPLYTASIDAALKLADEKLPGQRVMLDSRPGKVIAWIYYGRSATEFSEVEGATIQLAILIALFEALKAREAA